MDFQNILFNALNELLSPTTAAFALAAMGLSVHFGYTGLLNFGQAGYLLVGSYGFAIATINGWPFFAAIGVTVFLSLVLTVVLGIPTLRLRADYLAIVTISSAEILRYAVTTIGLASVTGGSEGLLGYKGGFASMNPEYKGMGTTCVVVYITNSNKLYYGHVGDSRLYLHNKQGLRCITKDHSFVQYLVDIGDIKESEMESHPSKNQILRALGIDEVVKPEVCPEPLNPQSGDTFLLCSDGLNGMVKNQEIGRIMESIGRGSSLESVSDKLIQAALDGGGKDNVTVGLISLYGEESDQTLQLSSPKSGRFSKKSMILYITIGVILLGLLFGGYNYFKKTDEENPTSKTGVNKEENKDVGEDNSGNDTTSGEGGLNNSETDNSVQSEISTHNQNTDTTSKKINEPNE
jgi:serine/threonine protein phosphatase PrpC